MSITQKKDKSLNHQHDQILFKQRLAAFLVIIGVYVVLGIMTRGRFLVPHNLWMVLSNTVPNAFMVLGFCFIFTMGLIDLSLGAILILGCNAGGILAVHLGLGYFGLIIGACLVVALLELFNLKMVLVTKIPSWIFGLGMAMVYESIGAMYNVSQIDQGKQVVALANQYRSLGNQPVNIIILLIGVFIAYIIFNKTNIGFKLRAVGSNREVASMMGINIEKTILFAGLIGALFIGMSAAISESYAGRVVPSTGLNSIALIFTPLAGFLLAQALSKLINLTLAALLGSFIITSLFNALTIIGVPSGTWQKVVMGAVVIVCGMLSARDEKGVVK
ncbi:MAG: ABC transporter permease [Pleomorphochaeta sp.]